MADQVHQDGLTACVFPGQGSQRAGMRSIVAEHEPQLLALAIELLGADPFERTDEGTRYVQPAIYLASIACWTALGRPEVDVFGGHSLGEVAALVAAGSLGPEDGLRIVVARGAVTSEAAGAGPESGMLAVISSEGSVLEQIEIAPPVLVANDNSPTQSVLAGPLDALRAMRDAAVAAGLRAILLPVEGAFHTPAMEPAVAAYRAALDAVEFKRPRLPVYSSVTAAVFTDIREELARSLVTPVRWREVTTALFARGVRKVIEPGPGDVVSKLMHRQEPRIAKSAPVFA